MWTLLLLVMGPVAWTMGFGAVPLAVFLGAFGLGRDLFPDREQLWIAFAGSVAVTALWILLMVRLFRVYDRLTAEIRGDLAGTGPVRGTEKWACPACTAPVTIHDFACRACGALVGARPGSRTTR